MKQHITVGQVIDKLKAFPLDAEVTGVVARPTEPGNRDCKEYICLFFCRKNNETQQTIFAYTFSKSDEK